MTISNLLQALYCRGEHWSTLGAQQKFLSFCDGLQYPTAGRERMEAEGGREGERERERERQAGRQAGRQREGARERESARLRVINNCN